MKERSVGYHIMILDGDRDFVEVSQAVRLLTVVDGSCTLRVGRERVRMEKTDVVLINHGDRAGLEMEPGAMLALISIDFYLLCYGLETGSAKFYVNSLQGTGRKYTELKNRLQQLLLAYVGRGPAAEYRELECYYGLLHTLARDFRETALVTEAGDTRDARLMELIRDIHLKRDVGISLSEIAERLYLSVSAASRLFRRTTGENFGSYMKKMRLEHVIGLLVETDLSITAIAVDSGFSTPSALNKTFKQEFGLTPSEYREKYGLARADPTEDSRTRDRLLQILREDRKLEMAELEQGLAVRADAARLRPWKRWRNRLLNVGPARLLSNASLQKQVLFLADRLNVEYIRVWNVISPQLMVRRGERGDYNFSALDEVLDFCVDHRLRLFIDLAQRKEVAMASERREIYVHEDRMEFIGARAWLDALRAFLEHIRRRYQEEVVETWIFELTFFLNDRPYYVAEDYSSRAVWEQGYAAIKGCIPLARVAGPGFPAGGDPEANEIIVNYMLEVEHRPDIFTSIHFPYEIADKQTFVPAKQSSFERIASRNYLGEQMESIRGILEDQGFRGEYWVTEWGNSLGNRNYIQDSCFRGAFILESVLNNWEKAHAMGIFYASDILNVFSDSGTELSGSAGLLTRSGVCKPAYYAYRFLNRLGRYLVRRTENCIVTAENPGDLRILCCNNKALGPKYYLEEENAYRPQELNRLFLDTDPLILELVLELDGNDGDYVVRQEALNEQKGSVLDRWVALECAPDLVRSDLEYLDRVSTPEISVEHVTVAGGTLNLSVRLEANEIRLITVIKA